MKTVSDAELEHWAAVYLRLNELYQLRADHDVTFELFMQSPAANEAWIHIYFCNAALFINRPGGGCILLSVFLENGPQYIMAGCLVMQQQPELLPLLPRQVMAAATSMTMEQFIEQEIQDDVFERHHVVELRGDHYTEPFHHYGPTKKYKSRGGVNL